MIFIVYIHFCKHTALTYSKFLTFLWPFVPYKKKNDNIIQLYTQGTSHKLFKIYENTIKF